MPRPPLAGKVRMNLELSGAASETLDRVVKRSPAETRTEAIRRALKVYDTLLSIEADGGRVFIERPSGEKYQLVLT